ncbi:MAG: DUF3276 family protein [Rhodothermales bacterium]
MSYERENPNRSYGERDEYSDDDYYEGRDRSRSSGRYRDEVYSKRVPAGKRTYFFDVKTTRSGEDFFLTITESKRIDETRYEKHKIFLYKEDFGKFLSAMHEVVQHIKDECLPGYEFRGLPELTIVPQEDEDEYHDNEDY